MASLFRFCQILAVVLLVLLVSSRALAAVRTTTPAGGAAAHAAPRTRAAAITAGDPRLIASRSHIETWAYADGCRGGRGASAGLVRRWVTFAESNCGSGARRVLIDCHHRGLTFCIAVQYLDASWIYAQGSVPVARSARENWWLHQPGYSNAAHRLTIPAYGGGHVLNQADPAVDSWFRRYTQRNFNGYDALMMDDSSGSLSDELWGTGFATSEEITTSRALQASHERLAAALTHTNGAPFLQIDNALSPNDNLATPFGMLNGSPGVRGLIAEGAPESDGVLTGYYSTLLDEMAYVDHTADDFVVLLSSDPSGAQQSRFVQAATVLLGYSAGHTVSWSDLESDSGDLAVWPEEGIVPDEPVQTMGVPGGGGCLAGVGVVCSSGGHNSLQVAPGVYRREFRECYERGSAFGECAAIVNTTGAAVTVRRGWLTQSYRHQITLAGGDVQSGGTVNLTGARFTPGASTVASDSAALLAR